jgi:membrane protein implicated in regulation of membrane protease activity
MFKKTLALLSLGFAAPLCAFAADISSVLDNAAYWIQLLIGIVAAAAVLVFFWGLVKYIAKADDEESKESGRRIMIGGVIALFVMFSIWGLVSFLQHSFGVYQQPNPYPPTINIG